jgi:hypothetical protein
MTHKKDTFSLAELKAALTEEPIRVYSNWKRIDCTIQADTGRP